MLLVHREVVVSLLALELSLKNLLEVLLVLVCTASACGPAETLSPYILIDKIGVLVCRHALGHLEIIREVAIAQNTRKSLLEHHQGRHAPSLPFKENLDHSQEGLAFKCMTRSFRFEVG